MVLVCKWNRLSLSTYRWVQTELERLYGLESRALVTHAFLECLLAGCGVSLGLTATGAGAFGFITSSNTPLTGALVPHEILLDHAVLLALLHSRLNSLVGTHTTSFYLSASAPVPFISVPIKNLHSS